ncbi:MAG TPA: four helix bundle protein [Candidatus Angelobacter sp.]|nr:four helix bundle protein [Candidatus Angelobacter sp.]
MRVNGDPFLSSKSEQLRDRTKAFALRIVRLFRSLPRATEAQVIGKQLLRSGTSVAANYRAACRARSKAEFVAKLGVVLEEVDESVLWIEMLIDAGIMKKSRLDSLLNESRQLTAIFTASRQTAKQK